MTPENENKTGQSSDRDLRELILSNFPKHKPDGTKSYVTVMTRLHGEYVEIVDALVKLQIFRSRSEAVGTLVMKTLMSDMDIFLELKKQASKMDDVQDTVRDLAIKSLRK
ncbi:MAG: hypothetical protein ACTSW8_05820 [Candidatus Thorarchaeota archaeon]